MAEVSTKTEEVHNFRFYSRHDNMARIIGNRKLIFGLWGLIGYIGQFILIVAVVNVYSDGDRFIPCGVAGMNQYDSEAQSAVYDTALRLLASYHIIEWVRMTLFLVTLLLGTNLMPLWYLTSLNSVFGIAAYIVCHVTRFSGDGLICKDKQQFRAAMLVAEVIVFWTTFLILSFPQVFFLFMSNENLDDALKNEEEEEEEDAKE